MCFFNKNNHHQPPYAVSATLSHNNKSKFTNTPWRHKIGPISTTTHQKLLPPPHESFDVVLTSMHHHEPLSAPPPWIQHHLITTHNCDSHPSCGCLYPNTKLHHLPFTFQPPLLLINLGHHFISLPISRSYFSFNFPIWFMLSVFFCFGLFTDL